MQRYSARIGGDHLLLSLFDFAIHGDLTPGGRPDPHCRYLKSSGMLYEAAPIARPRRGGYERDDADATATK